MNSVLIIGSGISGMACAVRCAELGLRVELASPYPSERSQSVMAAGGINAVTGEPETGDSVACHIEDTLKGGDGLGGPEAVAGLCKRAESVIRYLESIGTVFTVDGRGRPQRRAFGGQSHNRTFYCGASTGKQIVSALVMEARRFEGAGFIHRRLRCTFHSALLQDGVCYGALLYDESTGCLEAVRADAVVIATGGQNALFRKTTGSTQCDGYAAGRLFQQGAELKNLEFIQYHPTTLETAQKCMLVSEAARGEGGRLFYEEGGRRVYFMEDKYGPRGNLMTRDLTSREIEATGRPVFLDVSFLGREIIDRRLPEVRDMCAKFRGIDIHTAPIPIQPSVHFFMGGLAVHLNHETNIANLFAVGECAAMYHGANRLGGNSLLAAIYGGWVAAETIEGRKAPDICPDFSSFLEQERRQLERRQKTESHFPVMYIRDMMAETVKESMGIIRSGEKLSRGLKDLDYLLSVAEKIHYDPSALPYTNYSLTAILTLARAMLRCALSRKESRGSHFRADHPDSDEAYRFATLIAFDGEGGRVRLDKEFTYES